MLAKNQEKPSREKAIEWRLPAELEYLSIQDEYFKKGQAAEKEFRNRQNVLEEKTKQLTKKKLR